MFAIDNYDFKGKRAIIRVDFNVVIVSQLCLLASATFNL